MKSTLIALENRKFNSDIFNLLISTLNSEISVVSATPETLISVIKKAVRHSEAVFICSEFLEDLENREIYFDFFGEDGLISDQSGKITGLYSCFKNTPVAILPDDFEAARKVIYTYFYKNDSKEDFEFNASGSVYLATEYAEYIEQTLAEFLQEKNPLVTIRHQSLYTEISVTAFGNSQMEADSLLDNTKNQIKLLLGDDVYSLETNRIEQAVVNLLLENNLKIASAESCTGGLMSELITAVPNSSRVFEIGITSYSNRIKQYALSVNKETLKNYGAVSQQTAAEMAIGVKNLSGADIGVSITGVAGPSSSEGKPVGTVYIAITNGTHFWVRRLKLSPFSSREEVRRAACFTAFDLVRRYIECSPKLLPDYSLGTENINCLFEQPHYINSSLLFMKDSLSEYLSEKEDERAQEENSPLGFMNKPALNSPLDRLQKKVIKKHRVRLRFKFPKINLSLRDYFNRLFSTNDIKGFMLDTLTKVASLILISAILMVTVISANSFAEDYSERKLIETLRSYWTDSDVKNVDGTFYDFNKLNEINPDISGWLSIEGSQINNPVCLYRENNYYESHGYSKTASKYGSLYFGENTDFKNGSKNTVIYGNNLQNGAMFSDLINYKDKEFAAKAQRIKLTTKNKITEYEVFAVLTLSDDLSPENKNDYFDYARTEFYSEHDFTIWISQIKLRSLYDSNLPVEHSDKVITLVTDSFEFPSAKTVIVARAITENALLDDYPLSVNTQPKLPLIWYQINDLESPYHFSVDSIAENN